MNFQRRDVVNVINIYETYNGWSNKTLELPFKFTPCGFSFYAPAVKKYRVAMSCINIADMGGIEIPSNTWGHYYVDEAFWSNVQNYNVTFDYYAFNLNMMSEKPMLGNPYYMVIYCLHTEYLKEMGRRSSEEVLKKYYSFLDGSGNRINLVDIIKANLPFNYY